MCSGARRDGNALKAHPVVFTPNRLGDAGVRSEYPGSLVLDRAVTRPSLNDLVGLVVNLDREALPHRPQREAGIYGSWTSTISSRRLNRWRRTPA